MSTREKLSPAGVDGLRLKQPPAKAPPGPVPEEVWEEKAWNEGWANVVLEAVGVIFFFLLIRYFERSL